MLWYYKNIDEVIFSDDVENILKEIASAVSYFHMILSRNDIKNYSFRVIGSKRVSATLCVDIFVYLHEVANDVLENRGLEKCHSDIFVCVCLRNFAHYYE